MKDFPAEYSVEERRWLLRLAHLSIRAAVTGTDAAQKSTPITHVSPHLREMLGAFTTLHENGALRGCIGIVMAVEPLDQTILQDGPRRRPGRPTFSPGDRGRAGRFAGGDQRPLSDV